jgi:DNA-binding transcriptional ArsR family regulator
VTCADDSPEPDLSAVFQALGDEGCRAILRALSEPMTAGEISDTTAVPRSTTDRKLETLTEAGLLVESGLITAGMRVIVYSLYR